MKKSELAKIREKTVVEVEKTLAELRTKAIRLSAQVKGGKEKNTHAFHNERRNIAQTATILTLKRQTEGTK